MGSCQEAAIRKWKVATNKWQAIASDAMQACEPSRRTASSLLLPASRNGYFSLCFCSVIETFCEPHDTHLCASHTHAIQMLNDHNRRANFLRAQPTNHLYMHVNIISNINQSSTKLARWLDLNFWLWEEEKVKVLRLWITICRNGVDTAIAQWHVIFEMDDREEITIEPQQQIRSRMLKCSQCFYSLLLTIFHTWIAEHHRYNELVCVCVRAQAP